MNTQNKTQFYSAFDALFSYGHVHEISSLLNYLGDHPFITSAKERVGGSRKWPVLLTFSTVFMLIRWLVGVQKGQKYADVI